MKYLISVLLLSITAATVTGVFLALAWSAPAFQEAQPIPRCTGKCTDDVTGGDRSDQPQWCQNKDGNGYKANCECKRSCDSTDRGSGCKTYCRTSQCKCDHGCPMTR